MTDGPVAHCPLHGEFSLHTGCFKCPPEEDMSRGLPARNEANRNRYCTKGGTGLPCLLEEGHLGPCIDNIMVPRNAPLQIKETNPKDAVGVHRARWFSYIPLQVLVGVGLALLEGARKYGRHNYRKAGVRASVYVDAVVCGHITPWFEGEDIDAKSGLNHIDKAIASLIVLRDGMLQGNWVDDRPIKAKGFNSDEADRLACEIIDRYPDAKQAYTEKEHGQ